MFGLTIILWFTLVWKVAGSDLPTLECRQDARSGGCYALIVTPKSYTDAISYCQQHGNMQLAHMTTANAQFINELVRTQLSQSDGAPCHKRITMLANYDGLRPMRYGTYAFTMGGADCAASVVDSGDSATKSSFEVCRKEHDCSLVDWNSPNAFVCAKFDDPSQRKINEPWCMEKLENSALDMSYDYFVTCQSLNAGITEFKYPPMCVPFEYGDEVAKYAKAVQTHKNLNSRVNIALLSNFILPESGALDLCYPDANKCDGGNKLSHRFGLCRREKMLPSTGSGKLVQLWPEGVVTYRLQGWDRFPNNVTAIKQAMELITSSSRACVSFREDSSTSDNNSHRAAGIVQIVPNTSPNTCAIEVVGRKSGIQTVALGGQCFNKIGLLLRPLLHTLGIPAEHTRFDRDDYITVNNSNILDQPAFRLQAGKQIIPGKLSLSTPYDYDSVTHFPPTALARSKSASNVFQHKNTGAVAEFGQRTHLSEGDKLKLRTLYGEC